MVESEAQERMLAFLYKYRTRPNTEIEAKFGAFPKTKNSTLEPYTILRKPLSVFTPEITSNQFEVMSDQLHRQNPLNVVRTDTKDFITNQGAGVKKIRTLDVRTGKNTYRVKHNLEHLNILISPEFGLGIRISANHKENIEKFVDNSKRCYFRSKRRQSFEFGTYQFDLTSVKTRTINYEVEIELVNTQSIRPDSMEEALTDFMHQILWCARFLTEECPR